MSAIRRREKIVLVAMLVLVPSGIAVAKQTLGGATGESCEDLSGCKFGNVCIAHVCYAKCKTTSDCPAQMHCGTTNVTVVSQGFTRDEESGTERICFANAAASSRGAK